MDGWLSGIFGESIAGAIELLFYGILIIAILLLLAWIVRRIRGGTFVAGGHNRRTRLSVMDAAAVDSKRRLVLVRRDDIEHLILIGGNTDIVVEQNIRMTDWLVPSEHGKENTRQGKARPEAAPRRDIISEAHEAVVPAATATTTVAATDRGETAEVSRKDMSPEPVRTPPAATEAPAKPEKVVTPAKPDMGPARTEPVADTAPVLRRESAAEPKPAPAPGSQSGLDDALLDELETSLEIDTDDFVPAAPKPMADTSPPPKSEQSAVPEPRLDSPEPASPPKPAGQANQDADTTKPSVPDQKPGRLEDEMEKLLRELSGDKS